MTIPVFLKVGTPILTLPTVRPKQWAKRPGFVAVLNRRAGEVGVTFADSYTADLRANAWFRPEELMKVPETVQDRPGGARRPGRSVGAGVAAKR